MAVAASFTSAVTLLGTPLTRPFDPPLQVLQALLAHRTLMNSFRCLRLPVQDERDGRGRPLVRGEIDQESLTIRRHGVLLLSNAWHGTAGNANREQGRRSPRLQRLPIR